MTPPTHEQVAALEQWVQWCKVLHDTLSTRAVPGDLILALIASWREGQEERERIQLHPTCQALHCERDEWVAAWNEVSRARDAALARAEQLEKEVAHWKTCSGCGEQMDAPGHCTNADTEWIKGHMDMLEQAHDERDAALARAEQLAQERDAQREAKIAAIDDGNRLIQQVLDERDAARAEAAALRAERNSPCLCCSEVTQPCQHGCRCSTPESDDGEAQR